MMADMEPHRTKTRSDKKPRLTDAERHKRFVETAKKVGASNKVGDFDQAFHKVIGVDNHRSKSKSDFKNEAS